MTTRQEYAVLAGVALLETCIIALLCGIALPVPGAGFVPFLVAAGVVFYYSARHPAPFGVIAGLFTTLLLAYFSQSLALPTALLLLAVTGVAPSIEQLAPAIARMTFAGAFAFTALLLSLLTRGSGTPGLTAFVLFTLIAALAGAVESRYLIRRSPLEARHG
ncbi:MAG: hypothetical protein ACPL2N_07805 [Candidatus Cryosericum sp.]